MPVSYTNPRYPFRTPPEIAEGRAGRYPVVVVGAGLVGLTAAVDLATRGVPVVVLDDDDTVSFGSRSVCTAKRSLEILDRLGAGSRVAEKGIVWNRGTIHVGEQEVYRFDLLPEQGHKFPAFVNIQQYYVEEFLVERARALPLVDMRWKSRIVSCRPGPDRVDVAVETPEGGYDLSCDWLLACDGVRSTVRDQLGLQSSGTDYHERFLITDVVVETDRPAERRFWFRPPFHDGQSALMHKQPDNVWRIDLQLGPDADPEADTRPESVRRRIARVLGPDTPFEIDWISIYSFRCRRLERFRHGRVFFLGDAAHQVSPFGARGGNGGIQDADNLAWKLAEVIAGRAPDALLDSYDAERVPAADTDILASSRSTDFMTPKTKAARRLRDAVLGLAEEYAFARRMANSGRLSVPAVLADSPLNTPDTDAFDAPRAVPGAAAVDAPVGAGDRGAWLVERIGPGFTALIYASLQADLPAALPVLDPPVAFRVVAPPGSRVVVPPGADLLEDTLGLVRARYDLEPGTVYLFRPDQHVAGRRRGWSADWLAAALDRALARDRSDTGRT
jgi:3-(3-hydroxy-phenyl)propionate hydroxylase